MQSSVFRKIKEETIQLYGGNPKKLSENVSPEPKIALKEPEVPLDGPRQPTVKLSGVVISDVGCIRPNNEDNYILGDYTNTNSSDQCTASVFFPHAPGKRYFFGVFDGMGGGEMGELASRDTAVIFLEAIHRLGPSPSKEEVDLSLRNAFLQANNRIVDMQKEYRVFGTTGTVLCCNGVEFKIYHLGDSRAYLVRDGEMFQLTKDQTLAQMKLEVGMYKEDDPAVEADKHKLTEYIGRDWTRENIKPVESYWIPLEVGDRILLCSDGLYDMCTSEEITKILCDRQIIADTVTSLVETARSNGGEDNITCVLVEFT